MHFVPNKTYFLSGATGTEIQRRGFPTKMPIWSAQVLFDNPELLIDIHRDYIRAGADIITTNTFRTQRRTLAKVGLEHETDRINHLAVNMALTARESEAAERPVYIAASITSIEDCYYPERIPPVYVCHKEHGEHIALFADTPVDFFLLETFNSIVEAEIAAGHALETGKPFMISFVANEDGSAIFNGDRWEDAIARFAPLGPLAFMVNCVPPSVATHALTLIAPLAKSAHIPFGAYANGLGNRNDDTGWKHTEHGHDEDMYAHFTEEWRALGATFVGGCCGTSPEYTEKYTSIEMS